MRTKTLVPLALLALGTIWGSAFILMKILVEEISPTQIVAARLGLGALVLVALIAAQGQLRFPELGLIGPAALLCVIDNIIPNTLVAWSETRIESGMASVLISTMPLFTTIFAVTILKEGIDATRIAGLALGFIGVMVVSDADILKVWSNNGLGMIAVVGAAGAHAVAAIYTKALLCREKPLRLTALKLGTGAVIMLPVALLTQDVDGYGSMSSEALFSLILLGALATGAAYAGYVWVVGAAGAVHASLVTYVIPVAGLFLAWALLGESVGPGTIFGAMLIVTGVAGAMYRPVIITVWKSHMPAPAPTGPASPGPMAAAPGSAPR